MFENTAQWDFGQPQIFSKKDIGKYCRALCRVVDLT